MGMRVWLGSLAMIFGLVLSMPAWGQAKQDFTLVNKTGYALSELYVSPSKSEEWDEDILGRDVLQDQETADITFSRADKSCMWDLMVVYQDDDSTAVWHDIDLCTVGRITIMYNRKTDTTSARFD